MCTPSFLRPNQIHILFRDTFLDQIWWLELEFVSDFQILLDFLDLRRSADLSEVCQEDSSSGSLLTKMNFLFLFWGILSPAMDSEMKRPTGREGDVTCNEGSWLESNQKRCGYMAYTINHLATKAIHTSCFCSHSALLVRELIVLRL